jgi:methyl-accepting chemotaxis protein
VAAISNYRKSADQAFERAIARLSRSEFCQPRAGWLRPPSVRLTWFWLRRQADAEIASRQGAQPAVVSRWAPTITALIVASQNLRVAAAMDEDNGQARLSSLQSLKHFVWIMSEYLGRERATVAALIAAARPMNSQEIATLGSFRGRVEAAWDYVQAYAAKTSAPPSVTAGAGRLRERCSSASRGRARRSTPRDWRQNLSDDSAERFSQSTAAIDEVIALSTLASQEAARLAETIAQQFAEADAQWLPDGLLFLQRLRWMVISRSPLARPDNGGHGTSLPVAKRRRSCTHAVTK